MEFVPSHLGDSPNASFMFVEMDGDRNSEWVWFKESFHSNRWAIVQSRRAGPVNRPYQRSHLPFRVSSLRTRTPQQSAAVGQRI